MLVEISKRDAIMHLQNLIFCRTKLSDSYAPLDEMIKIMHNVLLESDSDPVQSQLLDDDCCSGCQCYDGEHESITLINEFVALPQFKSKIISSSTGQPDDECFILPLATGHIYVSNSNNRNQKLKVTHVLRSPTSISFREALSNGNFAWHTFDVAQLPPAWTALFVLDQKASIEFPVI